jgi:DNA-directed RNA polymerase specialized sigma24 family protein
MAALRRADRVALRDAYICYMPLLRDRARRLNVPPDECDELAGTVLADVLIHLQETDVPPRDLVRYLVGSLRNRIRNGLRDRRRAMDTRELAYAVPDRAGQRIVAECHSEYALRASSGLEIADGAADSLHSAIRKLAAWSAKSLTDVEATLMIGLSHHVPLRELAEQSGVSYGAARVRVHRLRERFHKLARQHVASLGDDERRELQRFFRRAGITLQEPAARPAAVRTPTRRDGATAEGKGHDDNQ